MPIKSKSTNRLLSLATCISLLFVAGGGVPPANAAGLTAKVTSFGTGQELANNAVDFTVEFSGGVADTANSCSSLIRTLGADLDFEFTVEGQSATWAPRYFNVADRAVGANSLTCDFAGKFAIADFEASEESTPISMSLRLNELALASAQGKLLNPNFVGTMKITSPTRGQNVSGFTSVEYSAYGGAGKSFDSLSIYLCEKECYYGSSEIQLLPTYEEGESRAGYAALEDDGSISVYFVGSGIFEIKLRASFGSIRAENSVFVNVQKSMEESVLAWDSVLSLVNNPSANLGLTSNIECGNSGLTWNKPRNCSINVGTSSYSNSRNLLNTEVPVLISTSLNGGTYRVVKRLKVQTGKLQTISVPVAKTGNSFAIQISIEGYSSLGSYHSANARDVESWGPPPTTISMSVPSSVQWGKAFKISISSNKSSSGSCKVLQNNISTIASIKIVKGKGSAQTKVVWAGGTGSSVTLPLFAYCTIGGVSAFAYRYTTGVR